jgi:molecular chaperone Hsp33
MSVRHMDTVLRAMSIDGAFRVMVVDSTQTVRGAISTQNAQGGEAALFADLLTGTVLFRETMSPSMRVQGIVRPSSGQGQLVADSHPSGDVRGLIQRPAGQASVKVPPGSSLRMLRSLQDGSINQGVVEIGERATISEGLMSYMQLSEQIVTMVAVGTLPDERQNILRAGGFLVQLLPGAPRGPVMVMTERLRDFENITQLLQRDDFGPRWLLGELLYNMEFTELQQSEIRFRCWCDELRVVASLATLPRSDLEELAASKEPLEIECDYCHKQYRITPAQLQGLLNPN